MAGGLTLLSYATYRLDPIFIITEGLGLLIYARNRYVVRHDRLKSNAQGRSGTPEIERLRGELGTVVNADTPSTASEPMPLALDSDDVRRLGASVRDRLPNARQDVRGPQWEECWAADKPPNR